MAVTTGPDHQTLAGTVLEEWLWRITGGKYQSPTALYGVVGRRGVAGVDMLLLTPEADQSKQLQAFEILGQAVRTGRITTERLDEAVRRVLRVKLDFGLLYARRQPQGSQTLSEPAVGR